MNQSKGVDMSQSSQGVLYNVQCHVERKDSSFRKRISNEAACNELCNKVRIVIALLRQNALLYITDDIGMIHLFTVTNLRND